MSASTVALTAAPRLAFARMGQALRGRDFRIWFFGQLSSASGSLAQGVALSWVVLESTGNAVWLSALVACNFGPTLLFGPWAGAVVDRSDRRRLLLATQALLLLTGLAFSVLTGLGQLHLWLLLLLAAVGGLVSAVDAPARQVFVIDLVGQGNVASAVGLWEVAINASRVLGPGAAGALLATVGPSWCFALNALTYCAPLYVLRRLKPPKPVQRDVAAAAKVRARAGLAYVWHSSLMRVLLPMSAASGLIFSMGLTLPTLASRSLHLGAGGYGALMAAFGLGGLPGALMAASAPVPTPLRVRRLTLATAVTIAVTAWAPDRPLAFVGMAGVGLTSIWFIASANTLAQLRSPDVLRGRVMALWGMAMTGTLPITGVGVTAIAQHISPRLAFSVSGVALLAAVLAGWRALAEGAPAPSDEAEPPTAVEAADGALSCAAER
jgi:MFS family permease